jgi:hypothetical protein
MKNIFLLLISFVFVACSIKEVKIINQQQDIQRFSKNIHPLHVNIKKFKKHYYSPWNTSSIPLSKKTASWANIVFAKRDRYYAENLLLWDIKDIKKIVNSTNFEAYNAYDKKAITTKNAQIRNLPTHKPFFKNPKQAGEGYPFDYMQNSRIHINTPLLLSHFSTDGAWAFMQNPFSTGWLPSDSFVVLSKTQQKEFKNEKKIVITNDNTAIYTSKQKFIRYTQIGAIFPIVKEDDLFYHSYIFINSYKDFGQKIDVLILKTAADKFPLDFNAKNISHVSNQLLGNKYGWGGYLANRDCSSMTKDFFATLGIWLPRNSAAQKNAGKYISLKGLSDKDKEKMILKKAIPFLSLLYLKGHIMLYIGQDNNQAIVMHDTWGIKTKNHGNEGRYIIGKTIISNLYIGKALDNVEEKSLLIKRIDGIVIKPKVED